MTDIIPFTHLHTHTPEGSLLDGFMRIEKAIAQAKEWGMDALGVSDHGTMAAHQKFYTLCKEEGIHPVLGMEAYITFDKTFKKEDFEAVEFIRNEDGTRRYQYAEPNNIPAGWLTVESFPTKKQREEMQREALETLVLELLTDTLPPGEELPDKKTILKRRLNALAKTYVDQGQLLVVKANSSRRDFFNWFPKMGHLLLIAKDNEGYQNLLQLNAIGQLDGFYGKPRIDYSDIQQYGKGVVATTSCLGSIPSQLIMKGKLHEAKQEIARYVRAFDEVFLEVQPSRQPEQWVVNNQLFEWSKELNLPLIATTDAHMVSHDELALHETLTNIGSGSSSFSEDSSDISVYESAYLMHPQEILNRGIPPEALQNAYDLSHRCQVDFLDQTDTKFPEYDVPDGHNFDSYLEELVWQGLFDLFLRKDYIKDYKLYQERVAYELSIIKQKKLSAYFVIVWDYINWARSQGIYVGPGRGSAAGSLVAYALSITNMDPLKYDLLFERFLNPDRPGNPDIDTDFSFYRRHEVIDYLTEKYGEDHVAQIGTYSKMSSKSILKNVGKVMGVDHNLINDWNKDIPSNMGNVMPLEEAVEDVPTIKRAYENHPQLFDLAMDLEKMPKSAGIHACGILVFPQNLQKSVPIMRGKSGQSVTQYEGPVLEDLGAVKFDLLGLKNLSIFEIAVKLIEERHGVRIDMNELEPDDADVFEMIRRGDTQGLFQLELNVALIAA